jgi:protein-S-isoprenylcysteine O-methyltransferase Ste14
MRPKRRPANRRIKRFVASKADATIFLIAVPTLILVAVNTPSWFDAAVIPDRPKFLAYISRGLMALGVIIYFWGRSCLKRNWIGGIGLVENHRLITNGPYRWIRNPLYAGILYILVGWQFGTGNPLIIGSIALFALAFN